MKSKWKVSSNYINDKKMFIVFRIKNIHEVDHNGNREYYGEYMDNRAEAETIAVELNKEENK